jgi:hypothetical protein
LSFNDEILNYEKASKVVDYNKFLVKNWTSKQAIHSFEKLTVVRVKQIMLAFRDGC